MNHRGPEGQVLGREEEKEKLLWKAYKFKKITNFRKLRLKTAGNKEYTILEYTDSKYA